ncbi:MAG TPA: dihydrolipoamide acetyltransferase family protein [Xanthobacteraceae bacterium]|nr:dihydrolipoamide acetyltransferase family protein [Xanthobacteraceae bacterium]
MTQPITMPALSDTMSNGRLVKWTRKLGEPVKKGDVIAEIETDKAVMEVEAFEDGYLSGPLAAEGTEAPVGEVIGYITEKHEDVAGDARAAGAAVRPPAPPVPKSEAKPPTTRAESPVSAVLAASMAIPQHSGGTGREHRRPATRSPSTTPAPTKTLSSPLDAGPAFRIERASSLREAVARNMIAGAATPTFRVTALLPLEPLAAAAKAHQQSLSLLLARACARTIATHPLFNAAYTPEGLARRERVDIGIAVDGGDGLITPVLRDAAGRSLAALAQDWSSLREKVKSRRLVPADYSGATFYLSDLGVFSVVETFDSIIPVGASAILSVAASRPHGASCTLACDHRVVFGADAARFFETLRQRLSDPGKLLI